MKDLLGSDIGSSDKFIGRDLLAEQLFKVCENWRVEDLVNALTSEFDEVIEYANLMNGGKTCQKTSLLFNPHRLEIIAGNSKIGIFPAIKDERWLRGLARACILNHDKINELLYGSIQLGVNGVQYVNEFPPHVARELAMQFGCNKDSSVLDPCAGWGGRMIGFSTVVNRYVCFEPSKKTYNGLVALSSFIFKINKNFYSYVHNTPFEDSELSYNVFDFAMTSPPYYDTEQYAPGEETNSYNRYDSFTDWCNGFYVPMIKKTMLALKPGKSFVINIGSRKYPLNEVLLDNFDRICKISKLKDKLSGNSGGLGKKGEGETFYVITKE
jgi:hypothetical protein